jgi:hypothetical protein
MRVPALRVSATGDTPVMHGTLTSLMLSRPLCVRRRNIRPAEFFPTVHRMSSGTPACPGGSLLTRWAVPTRHTAGVVMT